MPGDKNTVAYTHVPVKRLRNIGIIAHIDAGKTTTTERILYFTGRQHKVGDVDEGNTTMDYLPEERQRGVTIVAAATTCFWDYEGEKYRINLIDTPGHVDFTAEVERSLRVLDGAVVIFDGKVGVQAQTETVWRQADKYNVPRIGFVNKLNLIGGDFYKSLESIKERLSPNAVAVTLPIGLEHDLHGVVDLLTRKAYFYDPEEKLTLTEGEIPEDMKDKVEEYRNILVEKIVEHDDKLLEDFLEGRDIPVKELKRVLRKAVIEGKLFPIAGGDSRTAVVRLLLDMIVEYLPSPLDLPPVKGVNPKTGEEVERKPLDSEPFSALIFKVVNDVHVGTLSYVRVYSGVIKPGTYVWNSTKNIKERLSRVVLMHADHREEAPELRAGEIGGLVGLKNSVTGDTLSDPEHPIVLESIQFAEPVVFASVTPETKADAEKLGDVIQKVMLEDPTISFKVDNETGQTIIGGMGQFHLQIWKERIAREYGVKFQLGEPKVAYRETISSEAEGEGKFIKQTGGRGQYGHVILKVEPLPRGSGFEFVNAIKGGAIPNEFIPAVEKGVKEAMQSGVVAGYPVVDVKVTVFDGSYHEVDSSEAAFKIAGSLAFKEAAKKANPYLLEPIMKIEVVVPEDYLGEVTGLLHSKRAQITGTEERAGLQVIKALIPLSETFDFANKLRAATSGRGDQYMEFSHYEKVPAQVLEKILESGKSQS